MHKWSTFTCCAVHVLYVQCKDSHPHNIYSINWHAQIIFSIQHCDNLTIHVSSSTSSARGINSLLQPLISHSYHSSHCIPPPPYPPWECAFNGHFFSSTSESSSPFPLICNLGLPLHSWLHLHAPFPLFHTSSGMDECKTKPELNCSRDRNTHALIVSGNVLDLKSHSNALTKVRQYYHGR